MAYFVKKPRAEKKYECKHTFDLHLPIIRLLCLAPSFLKAKLSKYLAVCHTKNYLFKLLFHCLFNAILRPDVFNKYHISPGK